MNVDILMIGTELLLGQIVDTNAAYLGQTLAEHGVNLYYKGAVGDNLDRVCRSLETALGRSDVVLTSGGLGPTEDDLTREAIAKVFGRPLETRPELVDRLEAIFAAFGRPMTPNNLKQAMAPAGAAIIDNPNGTAPGILVEDPKGVVIAMPGVPYELKAMTQDFVLPYLMRRFGIVAALRSRVLLVAGMGESRIDQAIGDLMRDLANPTVGVLASPDMVRIRISARAASEQEALEAIAPVEREIRSRLEGRVFGVDHDTLEGVTDAALREKGWTLAIADRAAGGVAAQRLLWSGARSLLGAFAEPPVPGASEDGAIALAQQARAHYRADCGLATDYVASSGATVAAFVTPAGEKTWTLRWPLTDKRYQTRVGATSIELMRRYLAEGPAAEY